MKKQLIISAVLLVMAIVISGVSAETAEDYIAKGVAFDDQQRYTQALDAYEQALLLNASDLTATYKKAYSLYKAQRLNEALTTFKKMTELDPKNASAWYYQGVINEENGNKDAALDANLKARMLGYIV